MSRLDRQSFLGPDSDTILHETTIGIIGLGGGGSHIAQQSAHLGVGGYVNADPDVIDLTNTNRTVGSTLADVDKGREKIQIAERTIRSLVPTARIVNVADKWQTNVDTLKSCDVIIGAVDSICERDELERFARQHLIPYIDIGMDVTETGPDQYLIHGQVIVSAPGGPCLRCCGLVTDHGLEEEARRYGAAGGRPQVVFANGVLASAAQGECIRLLTPWFQSPSAFKYLEYDGNKGTLIESRRAKHLLEQGCNHYDANNVGDPFFDIRRHLDYVSQATSQPLSESVPSNGIVRWAMGLMEKLSRLLRFRRSED